MYHVVPLCFDHWCFLLRLFSLTPATGTTPCDAFWLLARWTSDVYDWIDLGCPLWRHLQPLFVGRLLLSSLFSLTPLLCKLPPSWAGALRIPIGTTVLKKVTTIMGASTVYSANYFCELAKGKPTCARSMPSNLRTQYKANIKLLKRLSRGKLS